MMIETTAGEASFTTFITISSCKDWGVYEEGEGVGVGLKIGFSLFGKETFEICPKIKPKNRVKKSKNKILFFCQNDGSFNFGYSI
jgi:hypothetical protein